jgi:hypothetical protein
MENVAAQLIATCPLRSLFLFPLSYTIAAHKANFGRK